MLLKMMLEFDGFAGDARTLMTLKVVLGLDDVEDEAGIS